MNWFKRIFGKESLEPKDKKVEVKKANIEFAEFNYPTKIILAWIKALEGHKDLEKFLYENGYQEIFFLNQAIQLKEEARDWLLKNGYPHLLAFVNAAEGNESAQHWLQVHGFEFLYNAAIAIDDEESGFKWLNTHSDEFVFGLIKTIKKVKDKIEFNHNDMYSFGKDI
jgi:hypothetical protein